jgi:hypothetical protein
MTVLESMAKEWGMNVFRIAHEKLNETRIIQIKGKNVDDLNLESLGKLIRQADENTLKVSSRGSFKSLKSSHAGGLRTG